MNAAVPSTIGWIGIGRMGYVMAERLAKAGADLTVWNRTRSKAEPLAAQGAKVAAHVVELADCDIVFVMVSTWDDVKEVIAGPSGLFTGSGKPRLVVECSSISLEGSAELRELLRARGIELLAGSPLVDEPVTFQYVPRELLFFVPRFFLPSLPVLWLNIQSKKE